MTSCAALPPPPIPLVHTDVLCVQEDFGLTIDIEQLIDAVDADGSGEIEYEVRHQGDALDPLSLSIPNPVPLAVPSSQEFKDLLSAKPR